MDISENKIYDLIYGDKPILELKEEAMQRKYSTYGTTVTFSPKVFIPLTTLCRDHCTYCTFVKSPTDGGVYLTVEEVLSIAEAGESAYCTEALFTLGDKPEDKWKEAKNFLSNNNCNSTSEYLTSLMEIVNRKTTLFPHANPGLMSKEDIIEYKKHSVSGGLMIETFSTRLLNKGHPHYMCKTKSPNLRVQTIEYANTIKYPMTTGLLIGIGQDQREIARDLWGLYNLVNKYSCIQEVIIQNFVPKMNTLMKNSPEPSTDLFTRVLAVARIILPTNISIQAPPNLINDVSLLLESGINDLGGVSPLTIDLVNPDKLWPQLDHLTNIVSGTGQVLKSRLPVYPSYIDRKWLDDKNYEKVITVIDSDGYTRFDKMVKV